MRAEKVDKIYKSLKSRIKKIVRPPIHTATTKMPYLFLGTELGGWPLLKDASTNSLIYSFGVGTDISFDLEAIARFSSEVHAFDPTPRSRHWIEQQSLPLAFKFHAIGVAAQDGYAEFAPPVHESHVSFSSMRAMSSPIGKTLKAPVRRIETLIRQLGTEEPSVIKLDIEGFEYEVIADMLAGGIRPKQFLVEFHHGLYGFSRDDTRKSVKALKSNGYKLFYVAHSGREYGFCQ